jgi:hypothetical protein
MTKLTFGSGTFNVTPWVVRAEIDAMFGDSSDELPSADRSDSRSTPFSSIRYCLRLVPALGQLATVWKKNNAPIP